MSDERDPLKGYKQHKKRLISPLNQRTGLTDVPWAERTLPEVLWLVVAFENRPPADVTAALDLIQSFAPQPSVGGFVVDGRISTFALVPEADRPAARQAWDEQMPWASPLVRPLLAFFPECPAAWLFGPALPETEREREDALETLRRFIVLYIDGRTPTATALRFAMLQRAADLGAIRGFESVSSIPPSPVEGAGGSAVRAAWLAQLGAHDAAAGSPDTASWGKHFWSTARTLARCDLGEEQTPEVLVTHDWGGSLPRDEYRAVLLAGERAGEALRREQLGIGEHTHISFPDAQVLLGMASRAFRILMMLLQQPGMWNNGSGSFLIRPLVEARIAITWLAAKQDPEAFEAYREHGRGSALLLRSHIERAAGGDLDDATREHLERQERLDGSERTWLAQDINLGSWGPSVRAMAKEVDLDEVYNIAFSGTSTSVHGEWTTVRDMESDMCIEPLHAGHSVAAFAPPRQPVEFGVALWALDHAAQACVAAFDGCGLRDVAPLFVPLREALWDLERASQAPGESEK